MEGISQFPNLLGTFVPTILADNERGNLNWNRPNPPDQNYKRIGCIGDGSCFFHAISKSLSGIYQLSYQRLSQVSEKHLQQFEESIKNTNLFSNWTFSPFRNRNQLDSIYTIINQSEYERSMQSFRSSFVQLLRNDFAYQLQINPMLRNIVLTRLNGEIEVQSDIIQQQQPHLTDTQADEYGFQIVINDLIQELQSYDSVDARYALLFSDYYNIDIYVIVDRELRDINSRNNIMSEYYNSAIQGPRNMRLADDPYGQSPSRPSMILIHVNGGHFEIVGKVNPNNNFIITSFDSGEPIVRQLYSNLQLIRQ